MQKKFRTLIINPKTDSTIIALFQHDICLFKETIYHKKSFHQAPFISDEAAERVTQIVSTISDAGINLSKLDAICTNGGLLHDIPGGTYEINNEMVHELIEQKNGIHASNLGAIMAKIIATKLNIRSFIVDPPVVNELSNKAKITGLPGIERRSIFHALNQKYVARKAASEIGLAYEEAHLIVAHIGMGITIGAHYKGKVIDVNNGLHGDGPFSIERAGTIPSEGLINLCYSGVFSQSKLLEEITYNGGLKAFLDTDNVMEIEERIIHGDELASSVFGAMAYQIAKEIGSMAAVLKGHVDGIVLTGHQVESTFLTEQIMEYVNWIADVFVYTGEFDLLALNEGALRILEGVEQVKKYVVNDKGEKLSGKGI